MFIVSKHPLTKNRPAGLRIYTEKYTRSTKKVKENIKKRRGVFSAAFFYLYRISYVILTCEVMRVSPVGMLGTETLLSATSKAANRP